jgi:hypothetical protein
VTSQLIDQLLATVRQIAAREVPSHQHDGDAGVCTCTCTVQ